MADKTRINPAARRSITSHPLFPVIVVLWCGALFGLASLAIRTEMMESAVLASGIDGVVPMASPPLGKTARILIALLATGLGCVVGLFVMRRVSTPRAETPVRRRRSSTSAEEAASPVSLFGGDPQVEAEPAAAGVEDAPIAPVGRRRRFTMAREEQAETADLAPIPGAQILNVADLDLDAFQPETDAPRWVRNLDGQEPVQEAPVQEPTEPAPGRNALFDSYAQKLKSASVADPAIPEPGFELLETRDNESADVQAEPVAAPILADDAFTPMQNTRIQGSAAERIANAPLDDLSPVELLERLALTIERRRAAARAAAEAAMLEAEEAPSAPEPVDPAPSPIPAAMRPIDLADEAHDEPLPGYVPPRHMGVRSSSEPWTAALPDANEDDDVLAEGYSSLRNLSRPAPFDAAPQRSFAASPAQRFDQPADRDGSSVFPFPAQAENQPEGPVMPKPALRAFDAPANPTRDKEAQLRDALATLHRMSGAA